MDFVAALSTQLKLEENFATGLAGALLLFTEDVVRERADDATAAKLRAAVPELRDWQTSAPTIRPGMLHVSMLAAPQGAGDERELNGVLSHFGVGAGASGVATSLTLQFLASRLEPALLDSVVGAMPLLKPAS